jgi:hypothetical protein
MFWFLSSRAADCAAAHDKNIAPSLSASITPSAPIRILHLFTLSAFAVAQPLFDILARHGEFFAVRQSQPTDLFALIFV